MVKLVSSPLNLQFGLFKYQKKDMRQYYYYTIAEIISL